MVILICREAQFQKPKFLAKEEYKYLVDCYERIAIIFDRCIVTFHRL